MKNEDGIVLARKTEWQFGVERDKMLSELGQMKERAARRMAEYNEVLAKLQRLSEEMKSEEFKAFTFANNSTAREFGDHLEEICSAITVAAGRDLDVYAQIKRFYDDLPRVWRSVERMVNDQDTALRQLTTRAEDMVDGERTLLNNLSSRIEEIKNA